HPDYARAHYQLARIYLFVLLNTEEAAVHIRLCRKFAPEFTEVLMVELNLLDQLNDTEQLRKLANEVVGKPGICAGCVWEIVGRNYERNQVFKGAKFYYRKAWFGATGDCAIDSYKAGIDRVKEKLKALKDFDGFEG